MGIKNLVYFLTFVCVVFGSFRAEAQGFPKRIIDGASYYVYSVEPGNTLYAISKQFSVSVSELMLANPTAEQGLPIGSEVLIPIAAINKKQAKSTEVELDGEYILHTVQKKETLFSISKKYGVELNELTELNPESAANLATGIVIRIPAASSSIASKSSLEPARNDSFVVHQVSQGETLYSLSKSFEVSQDSITSFNPGTENGLSINQYIVIPKYNADYLNIQQFLTDSLAAASSIFPQGEKATYNIGMMLPFDIMLNDSLEAALNTRKELYILTEIALDYYRGAKLALDSLRKMGLNANVFVYEVGEDIVAARDASKRIVQDDLDIVFGPMHKSSLAIISDACIKNETYLVSPNSFGNEVFEDNPFLMRAEASRETMMRYLANYVAIQHQGHNVLMVSSEGPKDWPYRKMFKQAYNSATGTFNNHFSDSLRAITTENIDSEEIGKWLSKDSLNVLVVPSNQLAFVSDFMTRLSVVDDEEYRIQVYGMDKWVKYDNIDAEYKNRFNLRLVVPSFVIYDSEPVIDFLETYRHAYNTDPSSYGYGYLGFDLTMFFGGALMHFGLGFPQFFNDYETHGVGVNYRFGKSTTGREYENKDVYVIEYNDFKVERVN